jgi:hypothetical protein
MEKAVETVTGRHHEKPHDQPPPDGAADQEFGIRTTEDTGTANRHGDGEQTRRHGDKETRREDTSV